MPDTTTIIAIDFDGTVVGHAFPDVGRDAPHCVEVLKRITDRGIKIILWTMRSSIYLVDAEQWYADKGIPLFGINNNPEQGSWSNSPKAYAHIYIDDAALGCPVKFDEETQRSIVDWVEVEKILELRGVI